MTATAPRRTRWTSVATVTLAAAGLVTSTLLLADPAAAGATTVATGSAGATTVGGVRTGTVPLTQPEIVSAPRAGGKRF